jgi:hypothetical protein
MSVRVPQPVRITAMAASVVNWANRLTIILMNRNAETANHNRLRYGSNDRFGKSRQCSMSYLVAKFSSETAGRYSPRSSRFHQAPVARYSDQVVK